MYNPIVFRLSHVKGFNKCPEIKRTYIDPRPRDENWDFRSSNNYMYSLLQKRSGNLRGREGGLLCSSHSPFLFLFFSSSFSLTTSYRNFCCFNWLLSLSTFLFRDSSSATLTFSPLISLIFLGVGCRGPGIWREICLWKHRTVFTWRLSREFQGQFQLASHHLNYHTLIWNFCR